MWKRVLKLCAVFLKLGAFTFGGGYAMIPLIQKEIVENKKWATDEEILDIFAISESTPGPIAVNAATFIVYKVAGFWGAIASTVSVVLPSFVIISVISLFFEQFLALKWVGYAFEGIRVAVVVLIINAALKLGKVNEKNLFNFIMTGLAFVLAAFTPINVVFVLLGAMVVGILSDLIAKKRKKGEEK